MLPDGSYDVLVVDAEEVEAGGLRLDLTVLSGEHKGEVVEVMAHGSDIDEVDALGAPGTLTVRDGEPHLLLEP